MYNVSYILYVIIYIYTLYIYPYIDITYNFYNWWYPLAWSGCQRYACEALNWQFQSYGVDSNFLDLHSEWVNMTTKTYQDSSGIFFEMWTTGALATKDLLVRASAKWSIYDYWIRKMSPKTHAFPGLSLLKELKDIRLWELDHFGILCDRQR
jgi:hypothetical protein